MTFTASFQSVPLALSKYFTWTSGDSLFETTCRPNFGEARALVQRDRDVAPDEAVVRLTQAQHYVPSWLKATP